MTEIEGANTGYRRDIIWWREVLWFYPIDERAVNLRGVRERERERTSTTISANHFPRGGPWKISFLPHGSFRWSREKESE